MSPVKAMYDSRIFFWKFLTDFTVNTNTTGIKPALYFIWNCKYTLKQEDYCCRNLNNGVVDDQAIGIRVSSFHCNFIMATSLHWRHNGHDGISNHQPHHCLLNRLFGRRSKKTSKLRVTGLCAGNSPGTVEFPAHMASNAENVSIWWRHHVRPLYAYSIAQAGQC